MNANYGYQKPLFRLFILEIRTADGYSACEFARETSRRLAIAKAMRPHKGGKLIRCADDTEMSPNELDQAKDWLKEPKVNIFMPSRSEPLLDRG